MSFHLFEMASRFSTRKNADQSACCRRSSPLRRILVIIAVLMAVPAGPAAAASTPYPGGKWSPPPAKYGVAVRTNQFVVMRDGARIPVDVYVPTDLATGRAAKGSFPVLLYRYWYTQALLEGAAIPARHDAASYFVERGYIYVLADVRGTGRSRDEASYLDDRDAYDGVDLANWAAALPDASGKVGFLGCSGMGMAQLNTARVLGPDSPVKAMIPSCVPGDPLRDTWSDGGVFKGTWRGLFIGAPLLFGTGTVRDATRVYLESMEDGDSAFDRGWWQQHNYVAQADKMVKSGAAILLWNGWDDAGFGGIELYAALQNAAAGRPPQVPLLPGMKMNGRYQLILGDWTHGKAIDRGIQLQWFETWLKGVDTGLPTDTSRPLHVQDRVSKDWFNLSAYPIVTAYTPLYLDVTNGALASAPPAAAAASIEWGNDPAHRLEYTGPAYLQAMRLAGPIAVRLNASSSNGNAQFRFELLDIAPDGAAKEISHGMVLGSMHELDSSRSWRDRNGLPVRPYSFLRNDKPLRPGQSTAFEIALDPTIWTIQAGHRLRLRVSTRPLPEACPSRGGNVGCFLRRSSYDSLIGGRYVIAHGGAQPSMISLPLVPASKFRPVRNGTTPTFADEFSLPLEW